MADDPPPRKLRLLTRGKGKVDSLLSRRKRAKKDAQAAEALFDSDIQDEAPTLAQLGNPSSTSTVGPAMQSHTMRSQQETSDNCHISCDDEFDENIGEPATKAPQQRGIFGVEQLRTRVQVMDQFIRSRQGPLTKQPPQTFQHANFTFSSGNAAEGAPSFVPPPLPALPTQTQLQQAARNAFHKSSAQPRGAPEESDGTQREDMTIQQFIQRDTTTVHVSTPSMPHHLDRLKSDSRQRADRSRIHDPAQIDNVAKYVRPQVEVPEPCSEMYRASHHQPNVPSPIVDRTVPDHVEAGSFALETTGAVPSAKKGENRNESQWLRELAERVSLTSVSVNSSRTPINYRRALRLPFHAGRRARAYNPPLDEASVPDSFYTAPNRLSNAHIFAHRNLKRKRPDPAMLPPPSYTYQHTGKANFNIFSDGFLLYPELCLLLAAQLPVNTLVNLYSLSKDWHIILNQRLTTVILNQATLKAPHAARAYPWRCFNHLSQPDPSLHCGTRSLHDHLASGSVGINIQPSPDPQPLTSAPLPSTHRIPTFRWLRLALHREKTLWQLYQIFASRGVPLPGHPSHTDNNTFVSTLHKLWFLYDIPDNARRAAYIHSPTLFSPVDISNALVFIVKLDMLLNDPVGGEKRDGIRKLLMSAVDGFDTILRVLKREEWRDELQMLRAWTRYGLQLDREDGRERGMGGGWVPLGLSREEHEASKTVFGIPRAEVGLLKREFWGQLNHDSCTKRALQNGALRGDGRAPAYLIRPDQAVLREAARRGLVFRKQFLRALLHGYVDEEDKSLRSFPIQDVNGGRSPVLEREGEYEFDDVVAGVQALSIEDGGDELLDLGDLDRGSPWTVVQAGVSMEEVNAREGEKRATRVFMDAWKEEIRRVEEERETGLVGCESD